MGLFRRTPAPEAGTANIDTGQALPPRFHGDPDEDTMSAVLDGTSRHPTEASGAQKRRLEERARRQTTRAAAQLAIALAVQDGRAPDTLSDRMRQVPKSERPVDPRQLLTDHESAFMGAAEEVVNGLIAATSLYRQGAELKRDQG